MYCQWRPVSINLSIFYFLCNLCFIMFHIGYLHFVIYYDFWHLQNAHDRIIGEMQQQNSRADWRISEVCV